MLEQATPLKKVILGRPEFIILDEEEWNLCLKCDIGTLLKLNKPTPIILPLKSVSNQLIEYLDKIKILEFEKQHDPNGDERITLLLNYKKLKKYIPGIAKKSTETFHFKVSTFSEDQLNELMLLRSKTELVAN